jgi:hypothetical protein
MLNSSLLSRFTKRGRTTGRGLKERLTSIA